MYHSAPSTESEAEWIISKIKELNKSGAALRDIAILYRAHYVTRPVEGALLKEKLPYRIYSGVPFFGRAEIKDALCYLRMVASQDDLSFRRIVNTPKRNIGRRRMAFLEQYAAEHGITLYNSLPRAVRNGWTILQSLSSRSANTKTPAARRQLPCTILHTSRFSPTAMQTTIRTRSD